MIVLFLTSDVKQYVRRMKWVHYVVVVVAFYSRRYRKLMLLTASCVVWKSAVWVYWFFSFTTEHLECYFLYSENYAFFFFLLAESLSCRFHDRRREARLLLPALGLRMLNSDQAYFDWFQLSVKCKQFLFVCEEIVVVTLCSRVLLCWLTEPNNVCFCELFCNVFNFC